MGRGAYSCFFLWHSAVRAAFTRMRGADAAVRYSAYASTALVAWPAGLNGGKPFTYAFVLANTATELTAARAGYPTLVLSGAASKPCHGAYC